MCIRDRYQKTEGGIQAVAVNTLGVLYVVEKGGDTIQSMADLAGRTIPVSYTHLDVYKRQGLYCGEHR